MTEDQIRLDERRRAAQELLEAMDKSGKAVQAGLWHAATLLDPSVNKFKD